MAVDDSEESLKMVCDILEAQGYDPIGFLSPREAISAAESNPPDVILLDAVMPEIDGYEVCERLKRHETLSDIPVIFVSARHEPFEKVRAFRVGAVDYLTKPFHAEEIHVRIRTHLRSSIVQDKFRSDAINLESLVEEKVDQISESQMALIFALAKLSESRDYETGRHMERIQNFCKILSISLRDEFGYEDEIGDDFIKDIVCTSALHDIGKVGIEDSILLKPGKLTEKEFSIMKRHSVIGAETLQTIFKKYPSNQFLEMGICIARSHHEKWNGKGYPDGLSGRDIPLPARIMSLADVYDALRAKRPYKEAFSHQEAVEIITKDRGSHFDPDVVDAFLSRQAEFDQTWNELQTKD